MRLIGYLIRTILNRFVHKGQRAGLFEGTFAALAVEIRQSSNN